METTFQPSTKVTIDRPDNDNFNLDELITYYNNFKDIYACSSLISNRFGD